MNRAITAVTLLAVCLVVPSGATGAQPATTRDTIPVNGIQMYYETMGQGPPLLLLHYFGGCAASWQAHTAQLAKHYRLIIPDLRGHGRSTNAPEPFRHSQFARDVFALMDSLGIERTHAMGMSSGGMTLLHMATQQPARIDAMVLVGASTHLPTEARAIMNRAVPDSLSADDMADWAQCSSRGTTQTLDLLGRFHDMKHSYDDVNFTAPLLSTISASTLIVHGDRDEYFPVGIAVQMYEAIPRAALWVIPRATHLPVLGANARAFNDRALAFLRSASTADRRRE